MSAMDLPETVGRQIAAEVRAEMGRRRITASELTRRLGRSHPYWARRLRGEVAFNFDDLEEIAGVLGLSVGHLLKPVA